MAAMEAIRSSEVFGANGEESPRSPEAEVGMKVEDLWDRLDQPQLTPTEKLNACFEDIPVSAFPHAPSHQGIC